MELDTLMEQFKNKDAKAFEKLYEMYNESIFGIINTIVKNDDIAAKVMQDVFIKAWNKSDAYIAKKVVFLSGCSILQEMLPLIKSVQNHLRMHSKTKTLISSYIILIVMII